MNDKWDTLETLRRCQRLIAALPDDHFSLPFLAAYIKRIHENLIGAVAEIYRQDAKEAKE